MKLSDDIMGDPVTRDAIRNQWPFVWRFVMAILPILIEIILGLAARQLRKRIASGTLGVDAALDLLGIQESEYPESLQRAIRDHGYA